VDIRIAAVGDCIITRSVRSEPGEAFAGLRSTIGAADLAFANLELLPHRFEGAPAVQSGGAWLCCEPALVDELRWLGFGIFGCAHNHVHDFGRAGLLAAMGHMDAMGVAYAGVGHNLAAARAPRYVETPAGRVALIATSATFTVESPAGAQRHDFPGRPGLNPLRIRRSLRVTSGELEQLRAIGEHLGLARPGAAGTAAGADDVLDLFGQRFVASERPGEWTEPDPADLEANVRAVREAARQADWVLVSLHSHESVVGDRERPAAFAPAFAHACIDAGAHAVLGHGPHVLRGAEIYRGRPILYSLGNFIFQNETMTAQPDDFYRNLGVADPAAGPADLFDARSGSGTRGFPADRLIWEGALAQIRLDTNGPADVEILPVTLGFGQPRPRRGTPGLAAPADAERIAARLDQLCRPFGARMVRAGMGWQLRPAGGIAGPAA
jgi:poly-gamma-glutamate synthesis protein (capsule biosynthesis protein)